jgi:hypothetical protein
MSEYFRLSLRRLWLVVSGVSLILPIFLPSSAHPQNFLQNVIGTTTLTMFILSFPSSLFGIPLFFFAQISLGIDPNTIGGMYLNLFLMFILGLVQWFWIVPRLLRGKRDREVLNLQELRSNPLLPEIKENGGFGFYDKESRTPLERALGEKE